MMWIVEKLLSQVIKKFVSRFRINIPGNIDDVVTDLIKNDDEIRKAILDAEKDYRQYVLEYEGRFSEIPRPVQYLRTSIRPIFTALFLLLTFFLVIFGKAIPEKVWILDMMMAGFWFGERSVLRISQKKL